MALHLLKMCVGCDSVEELRAWQDNRRLRGEALVHRTRNMPKRAAEVLDGGSLYWIIKGEVRVRQRIVGLDPGVDGEGRHFCQIRFDPLLVETIRQPRRPMQGWRYLEAADAPPDRDPNLRDEVEAMSEPMRKELRALGLL
jgi:hypothetical protein